MIAMFKMTSCTGIILYTKSQNTGTRRRFRGDSSWPGDSRGCDLAGRGSNRNILLKKL